MNGTPRLRSTYPSTPESSHRLKDNISLAGLQNVQSSPYQYPPKPVIPFSTVDAPSQRLYVLIFYTALCIWKIFDYFTLLADDAESLWLFMKWLSIDAVFLYGLPEFQIPWLQWSSPVTAVLVMIHAVLDAFLMFRIPIPLATWAYTFMKLFYDRELAVSERSVKPAAILHNSSLILGKQIIHVLPEGSSMLNPDQSPLCIGHSSHGVNLPIRINQTNPVLIEILRVDLNTNANETIRLSSKEITRLSKLADKVLGKRDEGTPRLLQYPVKKTGLYRLQKVVDESNLEVQRRISDALILDCPMANIKIAQRERCKGDLSNFFLEVDATPPFKIKYSKTVNRDDHENVVLNIHPETLVSPLARERTSRALVPLDSSAVMNVSWARTQTIEIPLNESLGVAGNWQYIIDEVQDADGNVANYSFGRSLTSSQQKLLKGHALEQHILVRERPRVALRNYDSQHPVRVEKGKSRLLPIQLSSTGLGTVGDGPYLLSYLFTPQEDLSQDQKHSSAAIVKEVVIEASSLGFEIREPGLYSLESISTKFCSGEIIEPSSCLLTNPPEPDLDITSDIIPDKCAGNSVGLLLNLDLFGSPPFKVFYTVRRRGGEATPRVETINQLHTQLELRPQHAGRYTYEFTSIADVVYGDPKSLVHKRLILEQDVKPPAAARILDARPKRKACIEEPVTFALQIIGEAPYDIDYELVYRGQRQKYSLKNVQESIYKITTEPLKYGGEYTLALTSIIDITGCKIFLKEEAKVEVGLQRPRAAFGQIHGKRSVSALEGKRIGLPLRLQGEAPWTLAYRNVEEVGREITRTTLRDSNEEIEINAEGSYEIIDVHDAHCPGSVDVTANHFNVRWIPRPSIQVVESPLIEHLKEGYVKKAVCQGDEDTTDISFVGTAPFNIEYEQRHKPDHGSQSVSHKRFSIGLNTTPIRMETSEAGSYEYRFLKLGDSSYNHDHRKFSPLTVLQRVHEKPSAHFSEAGKTYNYCKEEDAGGEVVPITLTGQAPFHLELEIKHHTAAKPELINIPNVGSNHYRLQIPHRVLALGTHSIIIRKVQDSRGCQRKLDFIAPHVQVRVADIPSVYPLEAQVDYCVGDRISYSLSGTPPFNVFYTFQDRERKAAVPSTQFRRIAETPGLFIITAISDQRSTDACKARTNIMNTIHEMPSVRVSKGRTATVDIHEGGEAEILFEFGGTPPFHFTYTRSTTPPKGKKAEVLETKTEVSYEYSKIIRASNEGLYEVVAIRDHYCSFSTQKGPGKSGQKLLTN